MELVPQFAAVALVLALLGAALWLMQRKRPILLRGSGPRQLEVVERVSLSPQHSLALVRVNGALVLVGTGPGLCEISHVEITS
jgi:flagellar biogenesis protein FliO